MANKDYMFTSESVSEGHPDKICDRISDSVVDLFLAADPASKVACETLTTTNRIVLAGETYGPSSVDDAAIEEAARRCVRDIGYEQEGFHWKNADVQIYLHEQSSDIRQGVEEGSGAYKEEGAGDQGIMFGYACNETEDLMPAPIDYAHKILQELTRIRHADSSSILGPDAKSQVTLRYEDDKPVCATSVVVSTQHIEDTPQAKIRELVGDVVRDILPEGWMCPSEEFYVNPTGNFVIGGPDGDAGLTGRKIIVDTYGGAAPHGGGAFSGKDPSKVDRSAAYAARYLAKNVVGAELADKCTLQVSYAIGVAKPLSLYINTHGTGKLSDARIADILLDIMDLTPGGIRRHLNLRRPIYERTASYGHFGRKPDNDGGFSWEKLDLVEKIRSAAS